MHIPTKVRMPVTRVTRKTTFVEKKRHHFHFQLSPEINMRKHSADNIFAATQRQGDYTPAQMH